MIYALWEVMGPQDLESETHIVVRMLTIYLRTHPALTTAIGSRL